MKYERQKGCGNDGLWKTRKTKSRFPIVSHSPWKSQTTTFQQPRRGAELWKTVLQVSHFPACCLFFSERRPGARFAPLQAHRSIRKCFDRVVSCLMQDEPETGVRF